MVTLRAKIAPIVPLAEPILTFQASTFKSDPGVNDSLEEVGMGHHHNTG